MYFDIKERNRVYMDNLRKSVIDDSFVEITKRDEDIYIFLMHKAIDDGYNSDYILEKAKLDLSGKHRKVIIDSKGRRTTKWVKDIPLKAVHRHTTDSHAMAKISFDRQRKNKSVAAALEYVKRHYGAEMSDYVNKDHRESMDKAGGKFKSVISESLSGAVSLSSKDNVDSFISAVDSEYSISQNANMLYKSNHPAFAVIGRAYEKTQKANSDKLSDLLPSLSDEGRVAAAEEYANENSKMLAKRASAMVKVANLRIKKGESRGDFARRKMDLFISETGLGRISPEETACMIAADRPVEISVNAVGQFDAKSKSVAARSALFISMMCDSTKVPEISTGIRLMAGSHPSFYTIGKDLITISKDEVDIRDKISRSSNPGSDNSGIVMGTYCHEIMHAVEYKSGLAELSAAFRDENAKKDDKGEFKNAVLKFRDDKGKLAFKVFRQNVSDDDPVFPRSNASGICYSMRVYDSGKGTEVLSVFAQSVAEDVVSFSREYKKYFDNALAIIQ